MPLYAYRATDADGKEVKGSLDAPSEDSARQVLASDLHLTVNELWEASRTHAPESAPPAPFLKTSFVFEGKDATGTIHKGTIQADSKYEAFEKLRQDHNLTLTLLTPMGVKAPAKDLDLDQWQPRTQKAPPPVTTTAAPSAQPNVAKSSTAQTVAAKPPPAPAPAPAKKTVGFTIIDDAPTLPPPAPRSLGGEVGSAPLANPLLKYLPLISTLRLYAGWLLAWYGLFVALGYYTTVRLLPFDIPMVMSFYASPLIYSVTLAVFLFLLCTAIQKSIQGKIATGFVLTVGGIVAFFVLRV